MAGEFEQVERMAEGEKIYYEGFCDDNEPHAYRPLSISKSPRGGYEVTARCKKCDQAREFFCSSQDELKSMFNCELSARRKKETVLSPPRRTG